jgi:hypothetical protein
MCHHNETEILKLKKKFITLKIKKVFNKNYLKK